MFILSIATVCLISSFLIFSFKQSSNNDLSNSANFNEIVFLLDISNSMNAIDATQNNLSRLTAAKLCINYIISNLSNTNFGLVIFAGQAQILTPISQDKIFIEQLISCVNSDFITNQGTNIEFGINESTKCFTGENINKTIIVLTDAENHDGNIETAIMLAKSLNIRIKCIGFGSENGSNIPTKTGQYLQNQKGVIVTTYLNKQLLNEISESSFIYPFNLDEIVNQFAIFPSSNHNRSIYEENTFTIFYSILSMLALSILSFIFVKKNT
jgi:Ca-activated chloride channel family protein